MPDIQPILDGGLNAALMVALWWAIRKWERAEEKYEAERVARSEEAMKAASELHAERLLNVEAKSALAIRDYRIVDLTADIERWERRFDERPAGRPQEAL